MLYTAAEKKKSQMKNTFLYRQTFMGVEGIWPAWTTNCICLLFWIWDVTKSRCSEVSYLVSEFQKTIHNILSPPLLLKEWYKYQEYDVVMLLRDPSHS
jgi:hypothetical protein